MKKNQAVQESAQSADMYFKINKIYYSIINVGFWAGLPAIIVRFADSHEPSVEMDENKIIEKISQYNCKTVMLTGSDPFKHDISGLIKDIHDLKCNIHIETPGTIGFKRPDRCSLWISCFIRHPNHNLVIDANEIKYIVNKHTKTAHFKKYERTKDICQLFLQPEGNRKENIEKCIYLIKTNPRWRITLNLSKVLINYKRNTCKFCGDILDELENRNREFKLGSLLAPGICNKIECIKKSAESGNDQNGRGQKKS